MGSHESNADPFTAEARLCDDGGMVSHEPIDDASTLDVDYLDRLNRLRAVSAWRGDPVDPVTEPFACTGHAHLAGEHIRCTSPAHERAKIDPAEVAALQGKIVGSIYEREIARFCEAVANVLPAVDNLRGYRCAEQEAYLAHVDSIYQRLCEVLRDAR